jgi:filamentous hemagglutinin
MSALETHYGRTFGSLTSATRIEAQMLNAGDGARGVIFGSRGTDPGHFFNVVNQNGQIRFLDGQTGGAASLSGFEGFSLLKTN